MKPLACLTFAAAMAASFSPLARADSFSLGVRDHNVAIRVHVGDPVVRYVAPPVYYPAPRVGYYAPRPVYVYPSGRWAPRHERYRYYQERYRYRDDRWHERGRDRRDHWDR